MSAEIIQLRDYQNPKDLDRLYNELQALEKMAVDVMTEALCTPDTKILAQGIDGLWKDGA